MTHSTLAELRAKATKGPWVAASAYSSVVGVPIVGVHGKRIANTSLPSLPSDWAAAKQQHLDNAAFIVALVNAFDRGEIVERAASAQSVNMEMLKALKAIVHYDNESLVLSDSYSRTLIETARTDILHAQAVLAKHGSVPDRETAWLVERKCSPPQYVKDRSELPSLTSDPWRAIRFHTEREAFDFRLHLITLRDECKETEHVFINKRQEAQAALRAQIEAEAFERAAQIADIAAKGVLTTKGVNLHYGTAGAIAEKIRALIENRKD